MRQELRTLGVDAVKHDWSDISDDFGVFSRLVLDESFGVLADDGVEPLEGGLELRFAAGVDDDLGVELVGAVQVHDFLVRSQLLEAVQLGRFRGCVKDFVDAQVVVN